MIHFYTSDAKDTSIIAYGDTNQKKRHFKITYIRTRYRSFKKKCGKYELLGISQTLEEAKIRCTISIPANFPPINTDVLVLLNLGQIRVGQWNGTSWHIHSDGLEQFLLNVSAWMPLPEIRDFYAVSA